MTRHHYQRVRTGQGRRENITISGVTDFDEIAARKKLIRKVADQLVAGGRADRVRDICAQLGAARGQKLVDVVCKAAAELVATESAPPDAVLFRHHALDWTSGRLTERFPDYVKFKSTSRDDEQRLRLHINPIVGDIPIVRFTLEDGQRVMRRLPQDVSSATRRHVAQVMYRLMRLAVYPCKLIEHCPLPPGFLPKIENVKAKQYLYPDEEARLLKCRDVPLEYRIVYGVLAREGMREGELIGNKKEGTLPLGWGDFDLDRGVIRLDKNKTRDPRAWAMDPSTTRALVAWRRRSLSKPFPSVDPNHFADRFRDHLITAGIDRHELTAPETAERRPIRGHDLRATFITIAFAAGKSEGWIQDRTGHTSSAMLNRYRRIARQFTELHLGGLGPMDRLIPELNREGGRKVGKRAAQNRKAVA
jgi:integrase